MGLVSGGEVIVTFQTFPHKSPYVVVTFQMEGNSYKDVLTVAQAYARATEIREAADIYEWSLMYGVKSYILTISSKAALDKIAEDLEFNASQSLI